MVVSINDLRFHYSDANAPVLDIPQWSVQSGEKVFLHGPSGTGKSTLLNVLSGIVLPNAGTIDILNTRVTNLRNRQRDKWRARHIGVVFQQFNLIPYLNAIDNVKLAAHFGGIEGASQRAADLLQALGIDQQLSRRSAVQLSIGQQQRVAIARALVNRPELLIVDEPTSALDSMNCSTFMSVLFDQIEQHHTTLIFVSHDLSLAQAFSRVDELATINRAGAVH